MKRISSRDNLFFKELRALVTDHREPRRRGETLADGIHLVRACGERGIEIRQLVVSDSGVLNPEIVALVERAGAGCITLSDVLFREATGIDTPTGIAAVIAIPPTADGLIAGDAVLLDAVQDAGNVGTILRTAAAAGVQDILLGTGCAGAWTPRVLRAGQGAHFGLRIREQVDLSAALAVCQGVSVATVVQGGESLFDFDLRQPVAWIFGNEGVGVSATLASAASRRATIPLAADTESLNVAAAAAVGLFEMVRQRCAVK